MPRDIPVGNDSFLITFDHDYCIRDIYYPHVGKENHAGGHKFRFGVWADGRFDWIKREGWHLNLEYVHEGLTTDVTASNDSLGVGLRCHDLVDYRENIYLKKVMLKNLTERPRGCRLFFHHDFHILESPIGDTAYFDPDEKAIIHYKGSRYFLMSGMKNGIRGVDQYSTGIKEFRKLEGTWRDAEDGKLEGNSISQGSVDSTLSFSIFIPPHEEKTLYYWMTAGKDYAEVSRLHKLILGHGPEYFIRRTENYWKAWVNKEELNLANLPQEVIELYKKSLLILATNINKNGAIIAANDSDIQHFARDTYSYMWPRDGALAAYALDKAGYHGITRQFFHFDKFRDIEFAIRQYENMVIRCGDFLASYRDTRTGLPLPCYDLWEEKWGIHTFTVASVYAGLKAAENFSQFFGDTRRSKIYRKASEEVRAALDKYLYNKEHKRFLKTILPRDEGSFEIDLTIDASIYAPFYFGVFEPKDERVVNTMNAVKERLWVKTEVGGIARYEGDIYHRSTDNIEEVPGNPWFICTLWLAQWYIAKADKIEELKESLPILGWVTSRALPSGVLAEQVHPLTNQPLSVSPLTWSHAAFVATVLEYLTKLERVYICPACEHPLYRHERIK